MGRQRRQGAAFLCLLPSPLTPYAPSMDPLITPDGRYLIVRGRLWRTTNPGLSEPQRERLVHELMDARRAVKSAKANQDGEALAAARRAGQRENGLGRTWPGVVDGRGAGLEPALGEELSLCRVVLPTSQW